MWECVVRRIEELCAQRNISFRQLAYISGMSPSTITNILNGKSKNPGVVTIKKICDGLEIPFLEFFDTEYFRELEQEIR